MSAIRLTPSLLGSSVIGQSVFDIEVIGSLAYVASGGGELRILDVSDPTQPTPRGRFDATSFANGIDVAGNLAYLASGFGGLYIIDVTNSTTPTLQGHFALQADTAATDVQVVGDFAYLTYRNYIIPGAPGGGLLIIDVSDPAEPTLVGNFDAGARMPASSVQVDGDKAYVTAGNQVLLFDVSDPSNPQLFDNVMVTWAWQAEGITMAGGLIYVTGYLAGLQIISTTPEQLTKASTITANGGSATSADGSVQLQFPAGAVQNPLAVLYMNQLHTTTTVAHAKTTLRRFIVEGRVRDGRAITRTFQPYTMVISYTDAQLAQLNVSEANLGVAYWDGSAWVNSLPYGAAVLTRATTE